MRKGVFEMKAILFDMDGLMIDSERLYKQTQYELAARYGKTMTEEIRMDMMGRKPIESISLFVERLNIPVKPEEMLEIRSNIMREKMKYELEPMPGLFHIIDTFYKGLHLAVCTGAQKEFLDIMVDNFKIREKFDVLQDSDEIQKGKPDPEIYLTAISKLNVVPRECFVLEDALHGVQAGKNAGRYVIAIPTEYTSTQNFSAADYIASDLFEAAAHIESILKQGSN